MTDYNKQTVAQLRQLLKERGIPSTGLQRKAQIVEKLQEADQAAEEAPAADAPSASEDAPEDAEVEPVKEASPEGDAQEDEKAPGPALSEAGEPPAQAAEESSEPAEAIPVATIDANRESVSHIDSDVPPPDQIKAIEQTAEDTTKNDEAGSIQPAAVFNAAPADPEDVVGPKITEPADGEMEEPEKETELAPDELPDAPGPAAEALRLARQDLENMKDNVEPEKDDSASSQVSVEKSSVEKPELLPIVEGSTAGTSRLNTEELEADSKKRKRRSQSPNIPTQDLNYKRRKSSDHAPAVHLKEDDDVVMEQRQPETAEQASGEFLSTDQDPKRERREKSDRYRNLGKPSADGTPQDAIQDDQRMTEPALHPATPALYIRNFMRPLRPEPLRTHLVSLASPPSSSPDASIVKTLFLDAMKTHALVLFSNMTAASRVRASLHGSIWPPEGNRKELWVDFVPEDDVENWIKEEEDAIIAEKEARGAGRPIAAKRFEVIYPEANDGSITAVFQEIGASAPANAPRGPRASIDARRPSHPAPVTASASDNTRQDIDQSFKTLDQLFSSTTAKPALYYLPVSDSISETRLKELDMETSRDWAPGETRKGRGIKMEMKYKYSFDEDDRLVEIGEDRGPWAEDYRGRGGFRGRGRGRGGGGPRGGGSWRG